MAWIDNKGAYGRNPHSSILENLGLVQAFENTVEFVRKSMKNWSTNLTSCGEYLANVDIRRGTFQGGSLSLLLFVLCMIPLTQILRKVKSGYTLKNGEKLNHLVFMDDLMIFFFSIWLFFHEHLRITGLQGKGEIISLTPHYDFHPLHRHLYISRAINSEGLPLLIANSWT